MFDGLSVAQEEYDQEVASRRDAEAEITRLRLQLSTQSAQIAVLTADNRKREEMEQLTKEMSGSLQGLEQELSKYKAERDLLLAEMEELASTKQ
jgi:UDP-N-acetylmuramyl tripeptide synthase